MSSFNNRSDDINDSEHFDDFFENLGDHFESSFSDGWERLTQSIKEIYHKTTGKLEDELSLPLAQHYVNDALKTYVTDNVKAILELRVEIHEGWFRLYCTIDAGGIYAEVASNFRLVHAQLDRNVQRFVFGQLTNTDILNLRCESFLKRQGIKLFIWYYHRILKKDPLGFILSYIDIARAKNEIIYIDINRWLKKNKKIINTLHKVQVNYGELEEEQLILKAQINYRDLLSSNSNEDIISDKDEPVQVQGPELPKDEVNVANMANMASQA